jgi:hypothetical protein
MIAEVIAVATTHIYWCAPSQPAGQPLPPRHRRVENADASCERRTR